MLVQCILNIVTFHVSPPTPPRPAQASISYLLSTLLIHNLQSPVGVVHMYIGIELITGA